MESQNYSQIKVLLIEDDPISNSIALIKLKQLGVQKVDAVENGLLALAYLENNSPDLIFLDIKMPTMDGFEFLKFIEKYGFASQASIAMLTSSVSRCDREWSLQFANVIDFLEKPLNMAKIEKVLSKVTIKGPVRKISF